MDFGGLRSSINLLCTSTQILKTLTKVHHVYENWVLLVRYLDKWKIEISSLLIHEKP